eukprot:SAG22_NODE_1555_length_4133_cov_3.586515_2_plen_62_part_00
MAYSCRMDGLQLQAGSSIHLPPQLVILCQQAQNLPTLLVSLLQRSLLTQQNSIGTEREGQQ